MALSPVLVSPGGGPAQQGGGCCCVVDEEGYGPSKWTASFYLEGVNGYVETWICMMSVVESVPGFPYAIVVFDSNIVELLFERNLSHSELAFCMKYFPVRRDQSL